MTRQSRCAGSPRLRARTARPDSLTTQTDTTDARPTSSQGGLSLSAFSACAGVSSWGNAPRRARSGDSTWYLLRLHRSGATPQCRPSRSSTASMGFGYIRRRRTSKAKHSSATSFGREGDRPVCFSIRRNRWRTVLGWRISTSAASFTDGSLSSHTRDVLSSTSRFVSGRWPKPSRQFMEKRDSPSDVPVPSHR